MLSYKLLISSAAFISAVAGAVVERTPTNCFTTHTGVLELDDAHQFGLDPTTHIMIYPAGSLKLKVELQV